MQYVIIFRKVESMIKHLSGEARNFSPLNHTTLIPAESRYLPDKDNVEIYQQERLTSHPLSHFLERDLDMKCFPEYFPLGTGGLNAKRMKALKRAEFHKCLIKNVNPQFRRDPQFLFYVNIHNDMAQISTAVYMMMNFGKSSGITAGQLRQKVSYNILHTK